MDDRVSRRGFLARLARWGGLGALAALVGRSLAGPLAGGDTGEAPCPRCPALGSCSDPRALQARDAVKVTYPGQVVGADRLCLRPGAGSQARAD